MIFALGFLFAGLLTLLFLPAFWRRALRLSTRRLEMQMPLSMTEIVAERDQLRAEFAAATRRVEQRNERLVEATAVHQSQLGRQAAAMVDLDTKLLGSRRDLDDLRLQLTATERQVHEAQGEVAALQKELFDSTGLGERRAATLADLQYKHAELRQIADEQRTTIGGLDTQVASLTMEVEDTARQLATTRLQLTDRAAAVELVARERDFARSDATTAQAKRDALQGALDQAGARIEDLEKQERAGQRTRTRMATQLAEQQRSIESLSARESALRETVDNHGLTVKDAGRIASERLQAMRAERDALQGAIDILRRDNQAMRQELTGLRRSPAEPVVPAVAVAAAGQSDALLRQTISEIGAEVARIAGALEAQDKQEQDNDTGATPRRNVAERMRDLQSVGRSG